ncbi:hypothetical protein BURK1_03552 [Burkholderiales bacterium]|nr:hypothetical protein BURK1_03552 [Burkholderiales bacterium]
MRTRPHDDPQRRPLHDEGHARPPARLSAPERIAHLALRIPAEARAAEEGALAALASQHGLPAPAFADGYLWMDCGAFRLKWERHTEFTGLTVFRAIGTEDAADARALDAVPAVWRASLPGTTLVYAEVDVRPGGADDLDAAVAEFGDATVIGARMSDGSGIALTDLRMDDGGCTRFVVLDISLTGRQAGRLVQRLLEIETYRMMALLAFPVARGAGVPLQDAERRLAAITERMVEMRATEESALLDDLLHLAAEVEQRDATTRFRFGAARAYHGLVRQRIAELREERIPGVQTIEEFMERRLAPAMATCESVVRRQEELSARIARAGQLLRTKVEVALERQNQSLLESMNRRARLQLRLQQTVEGLSIAAITYYAAGLTGYLAKAAKSSGVPLDIDLVVAAAIPLIAVALWFVLRRIRRGIDHP